VFTAGVGEHSAPVRARVAEKLGWLGVTLDAAANRAKATRISAANSRIPVFVIPTDEELMIASHALNLLGQRRTDDRPLQGTPYGTGAGNPPPL